MAVNQSVTTPYVNNHNHYPSQSGNYPHNQPDYQYGQRAHFSQSFAVTHNKNSPIALSQGHTQVQQQQNCYNQNFGNIAKSRYGS